MNVFVLCSGTGTGGNPDEVSGALPATKPETFSALTRPVSVSGALEKAFADDVGAASAFRRSDTFFDCICSSAACSESTCEAVSRLDTGMGCGMYLLATPAEAGA